MQPNTGDLVPCLVENKDGIQNTRCKNVVKKLAQILFSDYRLLKHFYKDCTADVKKFQCGRLDAVEEGVSGDAGGEIVSDQQTLEPREFKIYDAVRI